MKTWKARITVLTGLLAFTLSAAALTPNPLDDTPIVDLPKVLDTPPIVVGPPVIIPPFPAFYDSKTISGNTCQAVRGSQARDLNHYIPYLRNMATTNRGVVCPVVRDNTSNTNGTLAVRVYGWKPAGTHFRCGFYSYGTHGQFQQADSASANAFAGGNITLNLDVNKSANMGIYTLYCSIPRGGRLYGYKYLEFLRTDRNN